MKRITFVAQYLARGGAERVMSILINYFVSCNYHVRLILLYENIVDYYLDPSVEIVSLNWTHKMTLPQRCVRIRQLGKMLEGEIIISFLYNAIRDTAVSTLFRKRYLIVSERNDPNSDPPGKWRKCIRTLSYFMAQKVIFQTNDALEYFPPAIRKKGIVIPNPVKKKLPWNGSSHREHRIVSVCRIDEQKNIKMALDAFKEFHLIHTDYIYEIYGNGNLEDEINLYIKELGLENFIKLKGFSKNIHSDIINAQMYVSSSNYEGISNSMLEAMAIGLPVICTDCPIGGARQVITDRNNGLLIPVGDTKALVHAMLEVVENSTLTEFIRQNAYMVRSKYDEDLICRQWENIINEF